MLITRLFIGMLVVLVGAAGWRYSQTDTVREWLRPAGSAATSIRFDNGSSTRRLPEGAAATEPVEATIAPAGAPRKCKGARSTVYTDGLCPPGTKEHAITNGTVTVLDSHTQRPAAAPRAGLRELLDVSDPQGLAEKRMNRVLDR